METRAPTLTPRLRAVAELVREGAFVADVGTDHAYLPIALVKEGRAKGAVASDINEGPYLCATKNVHEHSLEEKISTVHCPGLSGIDKFSPTDILICGMGGELIASIIDDAPFVRNKNIRLVLQPMTHSEILRKYLLGNGFEIVAERIVKEDKLYQIICAEYSGRNTDGLDELELLVGKKNLLRAEPILYELLGNIRKIFFERVVGKQSAGADASFELDMIRKIDKILLEDK